MRIGKYFTLAELTFSQTAARRDVPNEPDAAAVANLRELVVNILDPLREAVGLPVTISSGYRGPRLNQLIGGAVASQHVLGQAADLVVPGLSVEDVCQVIRANKLPFDQLIDEFGRWVHVSYGPRHRREFLRARRVNGKTVYARE